MYIVYIYIIIYTTPKINVELRPFKKKRFFTNTILFLIDYDEYVYNTF